MRSHLRRWIVAGSRSVQRVTGRSLRRPRCSPSITAAFALLTLVPVLTTGAPAPAPASAPATKLEDLTVMALGALDGRAVIKGADGKLQVLKVGDPIPGTHAVVSQVLADKIVVQDSGTGSDKATKTQTVWISKPAHPGGKSTVQRLDMEAPPARVIEGKTAQPVKAQDSGTKTKKPK